jgi:hypothetical protein
MTVVLGKGWGTPANATGASGQVCIWGAGNGPFLAENTLQNVQSSPRLVAGRGAGGACRLGARSGPRPWLLPRLLPAIVLTRGGRRKNQLAAV